MISGCSTVPRPNELRPTSIPISDYCPAPQAFASWHDFTSTTKVIKGESPKETVKRLKLAEYRKNKSGQRLWSGMKQCRAQKAEIKVEAVPKKKPDVVSQILSGGIQ